ncbi:DUF4194 domain-containing protein [Robbsia sp. KACC 23696]|uniref:DUF4194 domain-containing protein n=1 Tax=Robbsia sp. KACC 23696 TaxID=3149231 RepID=UPI00325BF7E8
MLRTDTAEDDALASDRATGQDANLSVTLITLLKGVQYREADERQWSALIDLQARLRDYAAVLNLDLIVDEAEGYAFLKSRPEPEDGDAAPRVPRLIARRPLSFQVSLMIALLRKKLVEFDAGGSDTRLILNRDEAVEMVRVFLPDGSNEAKLIDQIDTTLNKVVDLGFLRKLKPTSGALAGVPSFEVRRILKAFVDAQWLAEFDARLAQYRAHLSGGVGNDKAEDDE